METAKECKLKPFEHFKYLLEVLPQADKNDKDILKRYLPYADTLPDTCHASDSDSDSESSKANRT